MEQSKEYFNQVAKDWDEMRTAFFGEDVKAKAFELAEIERGKIAADIGAGTGFMTEGLLQNGLQVFAVDQSEEMLILLQQKFQVANQLTCINCDGTAILLPDESVDYVFANMYLHHVSVPKEAIQEMYRILKPGGKLVITDLDKHNYEFLRTEQHDTWLGFNRDDILKWYLESGFTSYATLCVGSDCCADSNCGCDSAKISIFAAVATK